MSNPALKNDLIKVFKVVQYNKTSFTKQLTKLRHIYTQNDFHEFVNIFISLLKHPLCIGEKNTQINNLLEFAAKFSVSIDDQEENSPFLNEIFRFLVEHHEAQNRDVRYRICHFFSLLLNSMGEDAVVDDLLFDQISSAMLERIQDKSHKVRAEAVLALQRLQDPEAESCNIIKFYIFHMSKDSNSEVRENILKVIAKNKKTLAAALKRINDINPTVRKAAYKFISKVTVKSLTISQREAILKCGLKDRSTVVVNAVKNILLPAWLNHLNNNYTALLKGLDAENSMETSILTIKILLEKEKRPWQELMQQAEVDEITQLIPLDKISSEKVIFWHCLIEFISKMFEDNIENILPELTPFCAYIQEYIVYMKSKRFEFWEEKSQEIVLFQLFKMIKLYDLSDENGKRCLQKLLLNTLKTSHPSERIVNCIIDYLQCIVPSIDERIELLLDIINELRMPLHLSQIPTQRTINKLSEKERHAIKMQLVRLKVERNECQEEEYIAIQSKKYLLAEELKEKIEIINDQIKKLEENLIEQLSQKETIDEPCQEKNDPETITSCLRIMTAVMKSSEFKVLTPVMRTLLENLALVNIHHPDKVVRRLALLFLGICCCLDEQLAKKHIFSTFLVQFSLEQECPEICGETLKIIFDLLCIFGLEYFDITYDDEELVEKPSRRSKIIRLYRSHDDSITDTREETTENCGKNKVMNFLLNLMDSENDECRWITTMGIIKLLTNEIVVSARLLARIIIQLHNPLLKSDSSLLQHIVKFLNYFTREVSRSQEMLRDSYFIALKTLEMTTDSIVYQDINQNQVSDLIIYLTHKENQKSKNSNVHNELVFKMINELLDDNSEIDKDVLFKALPKLHLTFESSNDRVSLIEQLNEVIEKKSNSRMVKYVEKLKSMLESPEGGTRIIENEMCIIESIVENDPLIEETSNNSNNEVDDEENEIEE